MPTGSTEGEYEYQIEYIQNTNEKPTIIVHTNRDASVDSDYLEKLLNVGLYANSARFSSYAQNYDQQL